MNPLELELQVLMSNHMGAGNNLSSTRATSAPDHCAIPPAASTVHFLVQC